MAGSSYLGSDQTGMINESNGDSIRIGLIGELV